MYYAISHIGSRNSTIAYATSPTMERGTWTDRGSTNITSHPAAGHPEGGSDFNAIDPALIKVGSDYYMSFGSYWKDIYLVKMNANATAPVSDPATSAVQIEYLPNNPIPNHPTEASFIYQYTPPGSSVAYFYLFWSEGQANNYDKGLPAPGLEYKIRVCRSTLVTGPYFDASSTPCIQGGGELVLASHDQVYGPGAQGVIDDANGPIIYYRYGKPPRGRLLLPRRNLCSFTQRTPG